MKPGRDVNTTLLVLEYLRSIDDFASQAQIATAVRRPLNQMSAALHNLRRLREVDVVINPDGTGWWYALPQELSTRMRASGEIMQGITRKRKGK